MKKSSEGRPLTLGPVENDVMQVCWDEGEVTADEVRRKLTKKHDLKDSTIRTLLRRLEEKGLLKHHTEGRTFVYSPIVERQDLAVGAVRGILDRFCGGSVSELLLGMAKDELVSADELRELMKKLEDAEKRSL